MSKIIGKMKKVESDKEPIKEEKKVLKCLQGFDTSHIVDESSKITYEININDIKEKENNNFIKSNIEQLAQSIKEIGLQQPIVVKKINKDNEGNQLYEVIAGHRRLAAYSLLANNIGETEYLEDNPYLKIQARVIEDDEDDNKIYLQTNANSRNITLIEALLNCDLDEIDFKNPEFEAKYNNLFYPDGVIPEKEKYNNNSEVNYLERVIKDNFPNLEDISNKSVRNTYALIQRLDQTVINSILSGEIGIKKAMQIAKYPKDKQPEIMESILAGTNLPTGRQKLQKEDINLENRDYYKEMIKVDNRLKAFKDINLTEFNTDNWTANSKAYLKQMNRVLTEIRKLEEMPKK